MDPAKLYVTGGSGGGVLTCWMIGHTTRFRAAVPVYPVINWYSFVLTSDIGNWTALIIIWRRSRRSLGGSISTVEDYAIALAIA